MKNLRKFAIAIALLTTGFPACAADSTDALIAGVWESMPMGWKVHHDRTTRLLEVTRDEDVLSFSTEYKPRPGEKPRMMDYSFCLRIEGGVSDEEISRHRSQAKELDAKIQELYDGLVARAVPRVFDLFAPGNDEEMTLVNRLEDLRSARALVPDYFFDGHAVTWIINSPKRESHAVVEDEVRRECRAVQLAVAAVLTKHSNGAASDGAKPSN